MKKITFIILAMLALVMTACQDNPNYWPALWRRLRLDMAVTERSDASDYLSQRYPLGQRDSQRQ